ncbi:MAG TPA: efflux RND transporter periplasmic adaptor subunit [Kofleriaceae bacterium]|jgi:RND family efflux transporter MFP subunit
MKRSLPVLILLGASGGLLAAGGLLYVRNTRGVNHVALADSAKRVTATAAVAQPFQPSRRYVGTAEPWVAAHIGPQLVSAYVDTVLVRPGAVVKKGDIVATLDCRHASALSRVAEAEARAADAQSTAAAKDATRVSQLLDGKFVSENEVDQKQAAAASKAADVAALRAQQIGTALQVDDCVLRAPFDGEVATRTADPGAFMRPGSSIVTLVDRHLVRITADVPEDDFGAVSPGTTVRVHLLATGKDLVAKISRRAPAADPDTRTARIELDVPDSREIPVWTTAELSLDIGAPIPATAVPLSAASVHGGKATVFAVTGDHVKQTLAKVIGESGGTLFVDPAVLPGGTQIVTQGRTQLADGDAVAVAVAVGPAK